MHKEELRAPGPPQARNQDLPALPQVTLIAELGPQHRPLIAAHLLSLPAADRYLRFGHAIQDNSIRGYVRRLRFGPDAAFGAFDDVGKLHGFAHLASGGVDEPAELGLSVSMDVRRQGVGLALLERAAEHARNRGQRVLMMAFVPENTALASLARRAGMRLVQDPAEPRAYLTLAEATPESQLKEAFSAAVAAVDLGFRLAAGRSRADGRATSA
jgi:ribosomal protein S18 acetylase RimI-like enzyme